ncbi:hypothetical protein [Frigoribacterium sp. CG_9.8]|uniref:hypothetical protein n=1 Tax=Frigoribacterium sp. CG_9.8 TaxID=2787733 RepID=UPI0018CA9B6E|nr:hypothetical protein [Frigoribacterium sp. CG_9.8]MBG6106524.1 hypothetical protein [Frigoribacterium sp. CG_9.8]
MTTLERTRQQLDPVGTAGAAPVAIFLCSGALLYATFMTLRSQSEISHPVFALLALALLGIAALIIICAVTPTRAPLTRGTHVAAHAIALAAIVCEALGQFGSNAFIRTDWGPVTFGVLLVALGPYRPAREIASCGVCSAIVIGVITFLQVPSFVTPGPALAFIALAVTPMLALCLSAAAFSHGVVASIERWQAQAEETSVSLVRELRTGIARSVQQDRVTILNRDVLPFFTGVLARGTVSDIDRDRARSIAESIRQVMVEEVDRSWLESLVESGGVQRRNRPGAARVVVSDPHRVAPAMTVSQRTAIRAFLVAFTDIPDFTRDQLRIIFTDFQGRREGIITAQLPFFDSAMRSAFAPFFAVLRAVFANLEVEYIRPELTLRFSYDDA